MNSSTTRWVTFVGAGPGDPGLLTARAIEALQAAEVVIIEAPEHEAVIAEVRGADLPEVVDGGFTTSGEPMTVAARCRVVVRQAKKGRQVVRLITGDAFWSAAVAEEASACEKAGIGFDLVPGVDLAGTAAAYAGIPVTDRTHRDVVVVGISGSRRRTPDWARYSAAPTLLITGVTDELADIADALLAAGRDPETPLAVTGGTATTTQTTEVSSLAAAAHLSVPDGGVVVVGEVVARRPALSWFESKPLFGWRVLVPRTKEQAGELTRRLRGYGAEPEEVPTISVEPPRNPAQMDKAVRGLVEGRYEWIAFTSANAVRAIKEKFLEYGLDARAFSGLKIAAVGDQTAASLLEWGLKADLVPSGEQSARGLLADWPEYDDVLDPIDRVFLPRADIATETLAAGLVELGWEVDDVTAYRTVRATPPPAPVRDAIKAGEFDAVLFTSSSTVRNLVGIAGKPHATTVIACIGPATAKTAEDHGLRVDVMAPNPSAVELADALAGFGASRRAALLEQGEPVTRPSQRKPGRAGRRRAGSR